MQTPPPCHHEARRGRCSRQRGVQEPGESRRTGQEQQRTFKRRETAGDEQFEIAELALREVESRKSLGLGLELSLTGRIPREEVLEDAAVGSVGHCRWSGGLFAEKRGL